MFRLTGVILLAAGVLLVGIADAQPPGKGKFKKKKDAPAPAKAEKEKPATAEQVAFFEKSIRPVLVNECYQCHSNEKGRKLRGGLALDTRDGLRKGGDSGPAIVPGQPEKSLLVKALRHADSKLAMPPKKKLDDAVVADFERWVRNGAADPRDGTKVAAQEIDIAKGRTHWAFQPPKAAAPAVKDSGFVRNDVDRFVLAKLESKGIAPVADADRRTLIRRVSFDLTGLPPTPEEVEAFVGDKATNAFEKVVDRLLQSPRFGERWGRHWLDVARYAESSGKTTNVNYPHAWRYRDYVIAAFNADKPYDVFVKEQLAGDRMRSSDPKVQAERAIATGFLAIGPKALNERNGVQFELDVADEQIDVTTQAFLGVTASCARCHDHKFDPIPQRDYYALVGIFRSTETCYGTIRFVQSQRPSPTIDLPKDSGVPVAIDRLSASERSRLEKQVEELTKTMQENTEVVRRLLTQAQLSQARSRLASFDADGNPKLQAMGVRDKPAGRAMGKGTFAGPKGGFGQFVGTSTIADSPLYARGEPDKPSEDKVPRGTLQVLAKEPLRIRPNTSGRLELAEWISSKDNPLTARVMVNRVWLHLFGKGLVPSADNFGVAGQAPTHPELLDHLALAFMQDGWSVKKLIKRVVMSHAYQLDSRFDKAAFEADPENAYLWRMSPRRLDAESLRDSILAVSGQLETTPPVGSPVAKMGEGPTQRPRLAGSQVATNDPRNVHRSVFLPILRDNLPEALALFDAADPSLVAADRPTTTVPSQGLFLLNNPFVIRAAEAAGDKVRKSATPAGGIAAAYQAFYGRAASDKEVAAGVAFLQAYADQLAKDRVPAGRRERDAWAAFAQALFASAEFQYRK